MSRRRGDYLTLALWATMLMLVVGLFAPLMTVRQLLVLNNTVSVVTGLRALFEGGDYVLFAVILLFSVIFPTLKIMVLAFVWFACPKGGGAQRVWVGKIESLGRWSMLDVLVVAVLVVAIKMRNVSDVTIHWGLYVFAAAVIGSMLVSRGVMNELETGTRI